VGYSSRPDQEARLDFWQFWPFVAATILGNALSFAFFFAALTCSKLQKDGAGDDELPWWVYLGLIIPPLSMAGGVVLLV
jgi:hypothetical protein